MNRTYLLCTFTISCGCSTSRKIVLAEEHGRTPYLVVNRAVLGTERWRRRMADFRTRFER